MSMQFYSAAVSDATHNIVSPSSKAEAPQYLSPQLSYQQWFQQQLQQQAQQSQSLQQQQQNGLSFATLNGDGGPATFAGFLDANHTLDLHALSSGGLNAGINGQLIPNDAGLSLSALQSLASFQVHSSQGGQAFVVTPSGAATYVTVGSGSVGASDQRMLHQHRPPAPVTPTAVAKKSFKGKTGSAAVSSVPAHDGKPTKPAKPKGTPNAYAIFYKEAYAKLRQENPEWKASQIMAEAGKIWKELNGAAQNQYRSQAESLVQAHNLLHGDCKSGAKQKHKGQKRPMTAYQLFIREQFGQRPAGSSNMHAKDMLMQLSGQWKSLPDEVKKVYQERAQLEKTRRQTEADEQVMAVEHVHVLEELSGQDQVEGNDNQDPNAFHMEDTPFTSPGDQNGPNISG